MGIGSSHLSTVEAREWPHQSGFSEKGKPVSGRPLKGGFAAAYGDALRAPLTGRSPPGLGSASGLSPSRRGTRLRLNRDLV